MISRWLRVGMRVRPGLWLAFGLAPWGIVRMLLLGAAALFSILLIGG